MNWIRKKIKGSVFVEVIMYIMITGIIITTFFSVYTHAFKLNHKSGSIENKIDQYFLLDYILEKDLFLAKSIIFLEKNKTLSVIHKHIIDYEFHTDFVIRSVLDVNDTIFTHFSDISITGLSDNEDKIIPLEITLIQKDKNLEASYYPIVSVMDKMSFKNKYLKDISLIDGD